MQHPNPDLFKKITVACITCTLSLVVSCGGGSAPEADPAVPDTPVAYVERPLSTGLDMNGDPIPVDVNILEPRTFNGGAALIVRDRASNNSNERDITSTLFPSQRYDVKDLAVSIDGSKLAFAMRAPQLDNVDEDDQPTWNIWEYTFASGQLRRVINSGVEAELGHDIAPMYLPDGRIVFSSTRQKGGQAILTDESLFYNKSVFSALTDSRDEDDIAEAFNLHVMNADPDVISTAGQQIQQISFNQSHDLQPTLLADGRIAFLRWDRAEGRDQLSLYTIYPDGSNLNFLYGFHSQQVTSNNNPITFFDLAEMEDGRLLAVLKQRENGDDDSGNPVLGGDLIAINTRQFTELNQTVNGSSASGSAQSRLATNLNITIGDTISTGGYFNSAYPYNDGSGNLLVSWSLCLLEDDINQVSIPCPTNPSATGFEEADPAYGLYAFRGGSFSIIRPPQAGIAFTDVVIATARRSTPPYYCPVEQVFNSACPPGSYTAFSSWSADYQNWLSNITEDLADDFGTLVIRSIYDFDGTIAQTPDDALLSEVADPMNSAFTAREARFLRIVKAVSIPDDEVYDFDNAAFGVSTARGMREILGYAPIEPDGSVAVRIPSRVPFHIEIVNRDGQRLNNFPLHRNWLQLAPREVRTCTGCHTANSELPHGRRGAEAPSANPGAPDASQPFPNTNPTFFADNAGETMAQVYVAANSSTPRFLEPNLAYTDEWSISSGEDPISLRYTTDAIPSVNRVPVPPTNTACLDDWTAVCRIIINYEEHIQPIWDATRTGENNYQCTSCHTSNGNTQQPAGNLELIDQINGDYMISYTELLQQDTVNLVNALRFVVDIDDNQVFLMDDNGTPADTSDDTFVLDGDGNTIPLVEPAPAGQTTDLRIQRVGLDGAPVFVVDAMDNQINDDDGNPIPVTDAFNLTIGNTIARRMINSNAAGSRFFDVMTDSGHASNASFNHTRLFQVDDLGSTADDDPLINPEELRLLSEWLDIGAQYYNNPFDAPEN